MRSAPSSKAAGRSAARCESSTSYIVLGATQLHNERAHCPGLHSHLRKTDVRENAQWYGAPGLSQPLISAMEKKFKTVHCVTVASSS